MPIRRTNQTFKVFPGKRRKILPHPTYAKRCQISSHRSHGTVWHRRASAPDTVTSNQMSYQTLDTMGCPVTVGDNGCNIGISTDRTPSLSATIIQDRPTGLVSTITSKLSLFIYEFKYVESPVNPDFSSCNKIYICWGRVTHSNAEASLFQARNPQ